jgi:hypothetical protein
LGWCKDGLLVLLSENPSTWSPGESRRPIANGVPSPRRRILKDSVESVLLQLSQDQILSGWNWIFWVWYMTNPYLVGADWNHGILTDFPDMVGNGKSSQLTYWSHIFQSGRLKPPTRYPSVNVDVDQHFRPAPVSQTDCATMMGFSSNDSMIWG